MEVIVGDYMDLNSAIKFLESLPSVGNKISGNSSDFIEHYKQLVLKVARLEILVESKLEERISELERKVFNND